MKSFFKENGDYIHTTESQEIMIEFDRFTREFFAKYGHEYSPRELALMCMHSVMEAELLSIVMRRREERINENGTRNCSEGSPRSGADQESCTHNRVDDPGKQ